MGKKNKTQDPQAQGTLEDDEVPRNKEVETEDAAAAEDAVKSKEKSKEKKKRKEAAAGGDTEADPEAAKAPKKQKASKEVAAQEEGAGGEGQELAVVDKGAAGRGAKDESWDKKIDGQKFGEWNPSEVDALKERIKDWAAGHGCLDDFKNEEYGFLFKRRQKQGGRGAKLADSERKAFLEISTDFPTRNPKQIYGWISRHLDKDNYKGKWTDEEKDTLKRLVDEKGEKWKEIGTAMGRAGYACRDKWRMMKNNPNKGEWSEEEVVKLKGLVEEYFATHQAGPGRGPGEGQEHLPLLDNINWTSISKQLGTRNENMCMQKWYRIAPSAVSSGQWGAGEDKVMLEALLKSGAEGEQTVPWETLVPGRSLSQIVRRWKLMKVLIPGHLHMGFDPLVQKVVEKFIPDLHKALALPPPPPPP
eukprot:CAMPEP_0197610412 /NCGR_PEP_ID=MMETSP1326-20131121/53269_1 /TAXON_ID=1155430 /ORGANISM="Genus nov. species nov., Strain RCC2288" /LENGTH=416 /DNA_ID=CAMNT_0043178927 /DNA_START=178 /DNA_END=1425 /DNA_ORIENTATION=-